MRGLSKQRLSILLAGLEIKDRLLTPKQVAEKLNVKEQTLANWRFRGDKRLPWLCYGRRTVLYLESEVKRLLAKGRVTSGN